MEARTSWGVPVQRLLDSLPKCWRCLKEIVPETDDLGLCRGCVAALRAPPGFPTC